MIRIWRKIVLQRRRLALGGAFFFLAGLLDFALLNHNSPLSSLILAVIFLVVVTLIATPAILIFPNFRQTYEVAGFGYCLVTLGQVIMPDTLTNERLYENAWGLIALCLGFSVLNHIVYGRWSWRFGLLVPLTTRGKVWIAAPPTEVWGRYVLGGGPDEDYYSDTHLSFAPIEHEEATHLLRTTLGNGAVQEGYVKVLRFDPPQQAEMLHWHTSASKPEEDRAYARALHRLTPVANSTEIESVEHLNGIDLSDALMAWIDLPVEQALYSLKAKIEGSADPTHFGKLRRDAAART